MPRLYLSFIILLLPVSLQAAISLVALDSGEQLVGEVLPESTEESLVVRSVLLGDVKLPRSRVLSIQPKTPVALSEAKAREKAKPTVDPMVEAKAIAEERKILDTLKNFKAPDYWSGNLRFGINFSQGDRRWRETYAKGQLEIDPEGSSNFYRFNGSYTYRQTERSDGAQFKSTDKSDVQFVYRRTFLDDWFFQNSLGGRVDQVKGIDREVQEAVGIGYNYKPSDVFEVILGGGGGVEELQTDYQDTRTGLNSLANIFQEATWKPLQRTSLVQKFNYYWNPEDSNQFNYVLTAAIRVRLTDLLGFEFSYNKSYDNDVGDGDPQDDTQWRNALVVYF